MSAKDGFELEEEPLVTAFSKELRSAMERVLRAQKTCPRSLPAGLDKAA